VALNAKRAITYCGGENAGRWPYRSAGVPPAISEDDERCRQGSRVTVIWHKRRSDRPADPEKSLLSVLCGWADVELGCNWGWATVSGGKVRHPRGAAGAVLVLGTVDELAPGEPLVRLLEASRATALTIPPSAQSALPSAALPSLNLLITAGETCPAVLVDRWWRGRRMVQRLRSDRGHDLGQLRRGKPGDRSAERPRHRGHRPRNPRIFT
jgi:hypothetical protein